MDCTRIVTKTEAGHVVTAEPPARTSIRPDVIFMRHDGWSLGARYKDAAAAERMWAGEWVSYVDVNSGEVYHQI